MSSPKEAARRDEVDLCDREVVSDVSGFTVVWGGLNREVVSLQGSLIRQVSLGIGAVGTWWSGLNREVVSLQDGLIRQVSLGIGAVGTWWSGLNIERWSHYRVV